MEGTYPIIIDNQKTGQLEIRQSGIMTEFFGKCEDNGDILRLSVYGDKEGYLGVMIPAEGMLTIHKKLSKNAMSEFPEKITHAAPSGLKLSTYTETNGGEISDYVTESGAVPDISDATDAAEIIPGKAETAISSDAQCEDEDIIWRKVPNPWSLVSSASEKAAISEVSGVLTTTVDGSTLLAVPQTGDTDILGSYDQGEVRLIEDTEYAVFEIKNGRLSKPSFD